MASAYKMVTESLHESAAVTSSFFQTAVQKARGLLNRTPPEAETSLNVSLVGVVTDARQGKDWSLGHIPTASSTG